MDLAIRELERSLLDNPDDINSRIALLNAYRRNNLINSKTIIEAAALGDAGAVAMVGNKGYDSLSKKFYILRAVAAVETACHILRENRKSAATQISPELDEALATNIANIKELMALATKYANRPTKNFPTILTLAAKNATDVVSRYWRRGFIVQTEEDRKKGKLVPEASHNLYNFLGYTLSAAVSTLEACLRDPRAKSDEALKSIIYVIRSNTDISFMQQLLRMEPTDRLIKFDNALGPGILKKLMPSTYPIYQP